MPTSSDGVDAAVMRFRREVAEAIPSATILCDPNDRYGTFDAVLTVIGPMPGYDDLPPTPIQQCVRSIQHDLGVRLFAMYMTPQVEGEAPPTDAHVAMFGPRHLVDAAEAFTGEIAQRLPGARAEWLHDTSRDGFVARIEVYGPWAAGDDDQLYDRITKNLYDAEWAIQERYGLSFLVSYLHDQQRAMLADRS